MKTHTKFYQVLVAVLLLALATAGFSQHRRVALTIDDVPFEDNDSVSFESGAKTNTVLLKKIRAAKTPVTAFITGCQFTMADGSASPLTKERLDILGKWVKEPLITLGNHSERHVDNSKTDLTVFAEEVMAVDRRVRSIANDKPLKYFRFPYNALGKDSIDQANKKEYLSSQNYILTPFTIENADYIYNAVYKYQLSRGNKRMVDSIVRCYLNYTRESFKEAEELCEEMYGRSIDHIFLFHDLELNALCYDKLVSIIKSRGYSFITLDEALKDTIYQRTSYFHARAGIPWTYRWMPDATKRREYLRRAPDPDKWIYEEYKRMGEQGK